MSSTRNQTRPGFGAIDEERARNTGTERGSRGDRDGVATISRRTRAATTSKRLFERRDDPRDPGRHITVRQIACLNVPDLIDQADVCCGSANGVGAQHVRLPPVIGEVPRELHHSLDASAGGGRELMRYHEHVVGSGIIH